MSSRYYLSETNCLPNFAKNDYYLGMTSREMAVLSVSDRIDNKIFEQQEIEKNKDIDLILSCGDLPYYYIEKLIQNFAVPTLFVRGNHDQALEYSKSGPQSGPLGAIDLHNRVVVLNNMIFAGFEGSLRYREGPFMYTQVEMWKNVLSIVPQLLINKISFGRYLDVVIAHSPPWDIHDKDTHIHRGFKAFRWLIKTFKPAYFYHGHIHVYTEDQLKETIFEKTKVINTFGKRKCVIRAGKQHFKHPADLQPPKTMLMDPVENFRNARRKAALEKVWSTLSKSSHHLIQFQDIEAQLNYDNIEKLGLIEIPLDAIVASVNRYNDFTRKFFPREGVDPQRWQRVFRAVNSQAIPIDVYQIDEVFFVLDGNHRVSIARQQGQTHILANVTKIESLISLTPEDHFEDIIIKNQQARFLKETNLNVIRPEIDLSVTIPGSYQKLREQISIHHLKLEFEQHYPFTFQEAVQSWVDEVYIPVVQSIIQHGLLRDFPDSTPTDLFLWLVDYQKELSHHYGWQIKAHGAIEELARTYSKRLSRRWQRFKSRLFPLSSSQSTSIGNWRKTHLVPRKDGQIFSAILVAINGQESGWQALRQAQTIAQFEKSTINGLHIAKQNFDPTEPQYRELQNQYRERIAKNSGDGNLILEQGEVVSLLNKRALWNDLLVVSLEHPPEDKPAARLKSNIRTLIQTCPRPLLAVPTPSSMRHALLAFDGSPKATEALYLAAYLVEQWRIQLTVITALEDSDLKSSPATYAQNYLESRQIQAAIIEEVGTPHNLILKTMHEKGCDFLIVGGYGYSPVMEVLLGSTLDALLRQSDKPTLICH